MSTKKISIIEMALWFFIIVLLLLSLTPFALGFKVKSDYSKLITDVSNLSELDIKIAKYDRGFFSSDVILAVSLPDMQETLQFKEEVIHGPVYLALFNQGKSPFVAAVVKGQLDVSESQQAAIQQIFADNNPLLYQTIIDFSGDVQAQYYVPAVNAQYVDEYGPVHIQSSGVVMQESFSIASGRLKGEIKIPAIKVKSELFSVTIESSNMSFSGVMGGNDIVIGDSILSIGLLNIESADEQTSLRNLVVRSETSESAGLINSETRIDIRELLASNQKFGPLLLNVSLNGLNAESLNKIQNIQSEMNDKLAQGLAPEQVEAMMTGQIIEIVPELIKEAKIKIDPLSINSELGKLESDLNFSLHGMDENVPTDPMFLLGAIDLDLNISIDEALLKQFISWELENSPHEGEALGSDKNKQLEASVPMAQKVSENIQGMLDEQWMVYNEGVYLTKISMHQGELIINNKAVDPMQQMMSSMGGATQ